MYILWIVLVHLSVMLNVDIWSHRQIFWGYVKILTVFMHSLGYFGHKEMKKILVCEVISDVLLKKKKIFVYVIVEIRVKVKNSYIM